MRPPRGFSIFSGVIGLLVLFQVFHRTSLARRLFMPGTRLNLGTHQLHVLQRGQHHRGPTVVLEGGLGCTTPFWNRILPEVEQFSRVVAYDRAGYGWSTRRRGPCTPDRLVSDLKHMLEQSGAPAPYILAGHSFGGVVIRLFAQQHPHLVAGLVLADSSGRWRQTHKRPTTTSSLWERVLYHFRVPQFMAQLSLINLDLNQPLQWSTRLAVLDLLLRPEALQTYFEELSTLEEGLEIADREGSLGDIPLVVVRQGESLPEDAPEVLQDTEEMVLEVQQHLLKLSRKSRMVVARQSGHQIIFDQPEVVVQALRELHQQARTSR